VVIVYWKFWPGDGRLANLPCGHLHILLAHHADDVVGRQVARRKLVRVEPDAHTVILLAK
jgi:hypothetical protein